MEKDISNIELLESINRSFSNLEKKMATKDDLIELKLELKSEVHDIRTDLKSFKKDTQDNFDEVNIKLDDFSDTDMNYDKRIEKLENKVFA